MAEALYSGTTPYPIDPTRERYVLAASGGKDSTAVYCWAVDTLGPAGFEAVFMDTGHEHPFTVNYVRNLHTMAGGPEVQFLCADFSARLAKKGVEPSGNPFEDMLVVNGRAPAQMTRFCTRQLKMEPMQKWLSETTPDHLNAVVITGIRAAESARRSQLRERGVDLYWGCHLWRPGFNWSEEQVWKILEAKGVPPNPLYALGWSRVGCFPCIMARKKDLALLPAWAWDRLEYWENEILMKAKEGEQRTFFQANILPGEGLKTVPMVREWARTSFGGKQFDLFWQEPDEIGSCLESWGACE